MGALGYALFGGPHPWWRAAWVTLWLTAIRYGYVCPAPWYERPATRLRVRPFPTGPAPVNLHSLGPARAPVNLPAADKAPGRTPVVTGRPPGSAFDDFKRNDSLHWKAR